MRLEIDGWGRGMFPHKLVDSPIQRSSVVDATKRCASGINLAEQDGHILLRSKVEIRTSGEFDCRISLTRAEVMVMAAELLKGVSFSDFVSLMNEAGLTVGDQANG